MEAVSPDTMTSAQVRTPPPSPPLSQISDASFKKRGETQDLGSTEAEEATVIGTMRLLSALETLLGELGGEVLAGLGRANSFEVNKGFGRSRELIDDPDFFR